VTPILEMRADHIIPIFNHSRTFKVIIDWDYWRNVDPVVLEDTLVWFTNGSRMPSGTGSGILALDQIGNIRRAYRNKWILIFSDSQAALRAFDGPKVTSDLVAECLNALSGLARLNEVILAWEPGYSGSLGNEEADRLARRVSGLPLQGPEPALGILRCWQERLLGCGPRNNISVPGEV
jgi:hypothetical protein